MKKSLMRRTICNPAQRDKKAKNIEERIRDRKHTEIYCMFNQTSGRKREIEWSIGNIWRHNCWEFYKTDEKQQFKKSSES